MTVPPVWVCGLGTALEVSQLRCVSEIIFRRQEPEAVGGLAVETVHGCRTLVLSAGTEMQLTLSRLSRNEP